MKKNMIWLSVIIVVIIIAFLVVAFRPSGKSSAQQTSNGNLQNTKQNSVQNAAGSVPSSTDNIKTITLTAQRFSYTPNTITVNKGDHVKIVVSNIDFPHGIMIPDYGVYGIDSVEFVANMTGTFQFKCPTMCGSGHRDMVGTLIVQ